MSSLIQMLLMLVAKETMIKFNSEPHYYINILIGTITLFITTGILIWKNIIRERIFLMLDMINIITTTISFIALSIIYSYGGQEAVAKLSLDETMLVVPIVFTGINIIISSLVWYKAWTNKEKRITWN